MKINIVKLLPRKKWVYGFNVKKEFKIYKNVGEKNNKYFYENYTEWKAHIITEIGNHINDVNFYHWLRRKRDYALRRVDIGKGVMVPVIACILAIGYTFYTAAGVNPQKAYVVIGSITVIITIVMLHLIDKYSEQVSFYRDLFEIIDDERNKN